MFIKLTNFIRFKELISGNRYRECNRGVVFQYAQGITSQLWVTNSAKATVTDNDRPLLHRTKNVHIEDCDNVSTKTSMFNKCPSLTILHKAWIIQPCRFKSTKPDTSGLPELNENDIEETNVLGSGPGGQAVNKSHTACQLKHLPTGVVVKVSLLIYYIDEKCCLVFVRPRTPES